MKRAGIEKIAINLFVTFYNKRLLLGFKTDIMHPRNKYIKGKPMNFQYYVNFVTVVEAPTMTEAAKKLGIAQPALSNQIRNMERQFGTELFIRKGQRLTLSNAGRILYDKAKEIVELEQQAQNDIVRGFTGEEGSLRYGHTSGFGGPSWDGLMIEYALTYPHISFKSIEADQATLIKMLVNGLIEVAVLYTDRNIPDTLDVVHRQQDRMVAIWKTDSPLFADIPPEGPLPYTVFATHPGAATGSMLQTNAAMLRNLGFKPYLRMTGSRVEECLQLARQGVAMTVMPRAQLEDMTNLEGLTMRDMENTGVIPALTVVAQKYRYRSPVVNNFLNMLCQKRGWPLPQTVDRELMDIE